MVIGMLLASLAFIIAGVVQFEVQAGDKTLKDGETKLVMFNALPADVSTTFRIESIDGRNFTDISLPPGEVSVCVYVSVCVIVCVCVCVRVCV